MPASCAAIPVSNRINHVGNDDKECSRPVEVAEAQPKTLPLKQADMTIAAARQIAHPVSVEVEAEGRKRSIAIGPKTAGRGSSVNGGKLLFAARFTSVGRSDSSSR